MYVSVFYLVPLTSFREGFNINTRFEIANKIVQFYN